MTTEAVAEQAKVDLRSAKDGVKLFPGDEQKASDLAEIQRTIDWLNDFDSMCRGPKWQAWKNRAEDAFDWFRGKQAGNKKKGVLFLVFNLIRHRILTKAGILTSGKPVATVEGVDLEDDVVSQALASLLRTTARKSNFNIRLSDAELNSIICGLGVLRDGWDHNARRFNAKYGWVRGNFSLANRDPLTYAFDPDHYENGLRGEGSESATGYTVEYFSRRRDLMEDHPDIEHLIASLPAARKQSKKSKKTGGTFDRSDNVEGANSPDDTIRWVETWYTKWERVKTVFKTYDDGSDGLAQMPDGQPVAPEDMNALYDSEEAAAQGEKLDYRYRIQTTKELSIWHAAVAADKVLLWNRPSPYKHMWWPDIFLCGTKDRDETMPSGEVEHLITGSELVNSVVSLVVDNIARTNNRGMVIDPTALQKQYKQNIDKIVKKAGWVMLSLPGRAKDAVITQEATPIDASAMMLVNWVLQIFDEMSNIAQVQRGGMPYQTSGRGIRELVGAADTALSHLRNNINYAVTQFGRIRLWNAQQFLTITDRMRITEDYEDYILAFELHTPEGKSGEQLGLVRYQNGVAPDAGGRRMIVADFEALNFDIEVSVSADVERDPAEKRERAAMLQDRGLASGSYVAQEMDVPARVYREGEEAKSLKQMQELLAEAEKDPEIGPLVKMLTNPETMGQAKQHLQAARAAMQQVQQQTVAETA